MALRLRQDGLTSHVVGDEVVVLDLQGSAYFKANGSGTVLWELLREPRTREELRDGLIERYGIDADLAASDVANFIADLQRRGMIEESADGLATA